MFTNAIITAIQNVWPMLVIFLVVIVTARISYLVINGQEFIFYKEVLSLLFILYILLLFELLTSSEKSSSGLNLVPFTEILRYKVGTKLFYYNVIGNILLFIPFGYFVSDYIKAKKITHIFIISIISSITIELVQLKIGRAFDIDDIILNVLGAIIGFLLYIGLTAIKKHLPSVFQKNFIYNVFFAIVLILFVAYFAKAMGVPIW